MAYYHIRPTAHCMLVYCVIAVPRSVLAGMSNDEAHQSIRALLYPGEHGRGATAHQKSAIRLMRYRMRCKKVCAATTAACCSVALVSAQHHVNISIQRSTIGRRRQQTAYFYPAKRGI